MSGQLEHLVAYADTDAGGVVYHGRYVELAERSRLLALQQAGWSLNRLQSTLDMVLVVHGLAARFQRPARLEQWLTVATRLQQGSEVRVVMRTRIEHQGDLVAELDADMVSLVERRLDRIPAAMLRDLQAAGPGFGPADGEARPARRRFHRSLHA